MLPVKGQSWADLCDDDDQSAPFVNPPQRLVKPDAKCQIKPDAKCQVKFTIPPVDAPPTKSVKTSPWKILPKPAPLVQSQTEAQDKVATPPEPQTPEAPWIKVKAAPKTVKKSAPWRSFPPKKQIKENLVPVPKAPTPTPSLPMQVPPVSDKAVAAPTTAKPKPFSRRQLLRRVFADKYEEERQAAMRKKQVRFEFRVSLRCLRFLNQLKRHCRVTQLRKKVQASKKQRIIKKRLQLWVYNYRTKVYLSMVACCATHMWLEKNCLRHFFTTVKYLIKKHPRSRGKSGIPQETQTAMSLLDEITTFRHVFVDKTTPRSMVGQMAQTLRHYMHNTKRFADLDVQRSIGRHFRCPQLTQMLKNMGPSVDRHGWFWRKIMDATLRYSLQVPLKSGHNPDWILRSALMQIPAPNPTDVLAQMWSKITSLPVYYGFPAKSDPENASLPSTSTTSEPAKPSHTPVIPMYQEFREMQDLTLEEQQELAKIRQSLYEKQVELEHCKKQLEEIGGPIWLQRVSRLQELSTHLQDRSKKILAKQLYS